MSAIEDGQGSPRSKIPWPHAPLHDLSETGTFLVTAATFRKERLFTDGPRLRMLHNALLTIADRHAWRLEAWAVFPNHYHFIGVSPDDPATLKTFLRELHSRTAVALNRRDQSPGRRVWQNYRDSHITHQTSYLARLNYLHQNPVKHGFVGAANQYPYGSAGWFERIATPAQIQTIYGFKTDRLHIGDDDF